MVRRLTHTFFIIRKKSFASPNIYHIFKYIFFYIYQLCSQKGYPLEAKNALKLECARFLGQTS